MVEPGNPFWGASASVARRSSAAVESLGLAGITLFLLLFHAALLGGVSLLIVGGWLAQSGLFLAGLAALRLYTFLYAVGRQLFTPCNGR